MEIKLLRTACCVAFLLLISANLSACASIPAPAPTSTATLAPSPTATITPSPTATLTPTATPTPSIPEIAAADFAKYNLPTEGIQFETGEDGVVRAFDLSAKEGKQVVYEDGKFLLRFLAKYLKDAVDLMPTPYKPIEDHRPPEAMYTGYWPAITQARKNAFIEQYGFYPYVKGKSGADAILLDEVNRAWGSTITEELYNPETRAWLVAELADKNMLIIELIIFGGSLIPDYNELWQSDWEY